LKFTPLKDLLTKNHDDRVQEYLNKMEGLSIEEIVKSNSLTMSKDVQAKSKRDEENPFVTPK
jgi:hypothetical protein